MSRCFLLLSCALLFACDAQPLRKAVVVTPQLAADVASQLTTLEARVTLQGAAPQQGPLSFGPAERPFTLLLPADAKGTVQLEVTALAGVALARGHAELDLDDRTEYALDIPVVRPLRALPTIKLTFVRQVHLADLNGDGKLDLLAARADMPSLQVLLGQGDGTFASPQGPLTQFQDDIRDMATADLDGDGKLDLVMAHGSRKFVTVWSGNGDGSFGEQPALTTSIAASVAVGDLNGDGRLDIAVANVVSGGVNLFFHNGDTFTPGATVDTKGAYESVAIADINGDKTADLIMAHNAAIGPSGVFVALGLGSGRFGAPQAFAASPEGPQRARVADLNGDGHPDVVAASLGKPNLNVLLGAGDGKLGAAADLQSGGESSFDLAITDFNEDGVPDVLAPLFGAPTEAPQPGGVSLLLGKGDGTFQVPFVVSTPPQPSSIAVGDLNGDGLPDVVVNHETPGVISVLLHPGSLL